MGERAVECVQQANAVLGEGPVWDERGGNLFWLDIRRGEIYRHHVASGRQTGRWVLPARAGCLALTDDANRLVVTAGGAIHWLDLETGALAPIAAPESERPRYRFNDGAVDPAGRLWLGSMIDDFHAPERFEGGRIYRVEKDGGVTKLDEDYCLPNGIGWSPDGASMYLNDTVALTTHAFDYDVATGAASSRRPLVLHDGRNGFPDGLAIDAEGNIWSAMWDGWCIEVHGPDGRFLDRIAMPVRRPSSLAFAGEHLDEILVTSATVDFTSSDYRASPQAGGLFRFRPGARGLTANRFGVPGCTRPNVPSSG